MGKAEGPLPLLLLRKRATHQEQRLEPDAWRLRASYTAAVERQLAGKQQRGWS